MTVKIVKVRSLTTLPCAYSNTVDDGYFRYVTVDGKRVGDVVKFKPIGAGATFLTKNGTTENVVCKSRRAHWLTLKGKLPTTIKINVTN
jgi:hypothetical protein